jgi:sulfate permease, SulP family
VRPSADKLAGVCRQRGRSHPQGPQPDRAIGIALSLLWLIAVTTHPNIALLGREPGTQVYRDISNYADDEQPPGVAVVRLDGDLFFATPDALEDRIRDVIRSRGTLHGIVLDCEGINFVDSQGSAKMAGIAPLVVGCQTPSS